MPAIKWRGALIAGLTLAAIVTPVAAQERELLTLDEALGRTGVVAEPANTELNPRIVGPRAEAEVAQALVGQARLRPNPEISLEVENIAGSGAFSGLSATEYTLAVGQRIELGGKRGTRVEAARAQAQLADLRADLAGAELGFLVRERYVAAAAAASRVELALDVVERNEELARIAGLLVEVGREPPLRALRAEAALAEAQAELQAAEATSLAARTALASLWGDQGAPPLVPSRFPGIEPPGAVMATASGLQLRVARAESTAACAFPIPSFPPVFDASRKAMTVPFFSVSRSRFPS